MKLQSAFGKREERAAWLFILPASIALLLFTFYPMINAFVISFKDYSLINPDSSFVGLDNYRSLMSDPKFLGSLRHSFHFAIVVIPVQAAVALGMALLVYRTSWVSGLFRTTFFMPVVIAMGVASTLFKIIYNQDYGLLNSVLGFFGLGMPPESPDWGTTIKDASALLRAFVHPALPPAIALMSFVLGLNLLADALREQSMKD